MKRLLTYKWSIVLVILHLLVMAWFLGQLPAGARIPSHWNIKGEIDGWMGLTGSMIMGLSMSVGIFLLLYLMPYYDPRYRKNKQRMENVLPSISFIMVLFFALLHVYSLYLGKMGGGAEPFRFSYILIGMMFVILGNFLPKVPNNFFVGIKTPWTLSSEEVWQKTHRLGGWIFVISGLMLCVKAFIPMQMKDLHAVLMWVALLILMYPILYSFILYRRIGKR
ncbi:MAG: SdpI family protein [Candidatus Cloacimonetes bacterium]|jgi:uncharacterized membrane protein|nr:SdpI family protein [Candidatus Cloacimonadota bacterium]MCB5286517.1 SdpI family protein [Candidatus Cloacimonadota bacterium]MCK9185141.1 SdpI family protein [Candidatus Cloacimonadota bacterium]MCK9584278.1 SdpI family protein [Candidatus Cloacimonadota bacterium]MDY0228839.1 SdpI family protein [Candidatus Cloacimonadaceae bacterium]